MRFLVLAGIVGMIVGTIIGMIAELLDEHDAAKGDTKG